MFEGPAVIPLMKRGLVKLLARDGYKHIADARGVDAAALVAKLDAAQSETPSKARAKGTPSQKPESSAPKSPSKKSKQQKPAAKTAKTAKSTGAQKPTAKKAPAKRQAAKGGGPAK